MKTFAIDVRKHYANDPEVLSCLQPNVDYRIVCREDGRCVMEGWDGKLAEWRPLFNHRESRRHIEQLRREANAEWQ